MIAKKINPKELLSYDRLDLVAKILLAKKYVKHKSNNVNEKRIYLNSINYINGFVENDKSKKIGKTKFLNKFKFVTNSIAKKGFDKKFPILIDKKTKKLVDGAHRVAISIALNKKKIYFKEADKGIVNLDYKNLLKKNMPQFLVEELVYYFCKLEKNSRIIFLWPNIDFIKNKKFLLNQIRKYGDVIYLNKIDLTEKGKVNLITNIYKNEKWVSSDKKFNSGAKNKSFNCFKDKSFFYFCIIKKKKNIIKLKKEIRARFKSGKHTIHTNDRHNETISILQILLNKNSLHNLNYKINKEFSWHNRLHVELKKWIKRNNYSVEDFCIEGSAVLSAYGLRESRDLDYFCNSNIKKKLKFKEIGNSNNINKRYFKNIFELFNNPNNFFYFNGLKYLSLNKIKIKKQKRKEPKDIEDLIMIKNLEKESPYKYIKYNIKDLFNLILLKNKIKFYLLKLRFFIFKIIYYFD